MIRYLEAAPVLPNVSGFGLRVSFDISIAHVISVCSFQRTHDPVIIGHNDFSYL